MAYDIHAIHEKLKGKLSQKRFYHSLGVEYTSASLAMSHRADIDQALLAGILHDCAKYMPDARLLAKCEKYHIPITEMERNHAYLLHAKLGAYYAEHKYHVTESEIVSAIRYHTTGRADMTMLEKIVFIADYIEPGRGNIPNLTQIRKVAFLDIDEAVLLILKNTLTYLKEEKRASIDSTTIDAFEFYQNRTTV